MVLIRLEHISKTFVTDAGSVAAVKDVSLDIEDGDIYGIIGFSGAGKSTLVRCINLLERPTEGRVTVNGQDMLALKQAELRKARKKIGMIFQHFNLMPSRTVSENVAYPLKKSGMTKTQIAEKVHKLLDFVEIADKGDAYPSQLSGGQKQRVAIARALANDPDILLCDEATSALDPTTTTAILQLLKSLNRKLGITMVIITHEMAVVKRICNRVAVMERGELIEQGPVFDLFSNPKQQLTRDFIKTTSNLYKIDDFLQSDSSITRIGDGQVLARLTYIRKNVSEPLISATSRQFDLDLNIVFADVDIVDDAPLGGTVVVFEGDAQNIEAALQSLRDKNVGVEVIRDGRRS